MVSIINFGFSYLLDTISKMFNIQKIKKLRVLRHVRFYNKWAVTGAVAIAAAVILAIILALSRPGSNTSGYQESLDNLVKSIEALSGGLEVPEKNHTRSDLDAYRLSLDDLDKQCSQLIKQKRPDNSSEGKVVGERITGICEDLIPVAYYSRQLHEQIRDYVLLSDAEWPKPGKTEFNNRLESTAKIISETKRNLETLNNRKVQDPALDELLYQIKFAQDIAIKVKNAGNNHEEAQKQAENLRSEIARDRTDFLAARLYFWNNTIGIEQLIKALEGIEESLKSVEGPIKFNPNSISD